MTRTDVAILAAFACVCCLVAGMYLGHRDAELLQAMQAAQTNCNQQPTKGTK